MTETPTPPHVVGADVSLTATGLAWPDRHTMTHGAAGLTNPRTYVGDRAEGLDQLAEELYSHIIGRRATFEDWLPRLVVLEDFPAGSTRIDPERGYLWWRVVKLLTSMHQIPVLVVPPNNLKQYACGMGSANKREVFAGMSEWFPGWELHKTGKRGNVLTSPDYDKADAVALMAIGCELLGEPLVELPAKHRKALDKLELPPGVRRA